MPVSEADLLRDTLSKFSITEEEDLPEVNFDEIETLNRKARKVSGAYSPLIWNAIKSKYVTGTVVTDPDHGKVTIYSSLQELSEEYGVPITTIKQRSSNGGWLKERKLFANTVIETKKANLLNDVISKSSKYDKRHLASLDRLHDIVDFYFTRYESMLEIVDDPSLSTGEQLAYALNSKLGIKELQSIMTILKDSHNLVRNIVGEPINAEALIQDLKDQSKTEITTEAKKSQISDLASRIKGS